MITRDEENSLPRCLSSVRPWVDQICVVDTGSRDATVKIARSFGAEVTSVTWENDFSKARNRSLEMASQPWILVIDADEELDQATGPKLREVANSSGKLAFLLSREDLRADAPAKRIALARILRRDPNIRFSRPVHESIMDSLFALGTSAPGDSGVRLLHYGAISPKLFASAKTRAQSRDFPANTVPRGPRRSRQSVQARGDLAPLMRAPRSSRRSRGRARCRESSAPRKRPNYRSSRPCAMRTPRGSLLAESSRARFRSPIRAGAPSRDRKPRLPAGRARPRRGRHRERGAMALPSARLAAHLGNSGPTDHRARREMLGLAARVSLHTSRPTRRNLDARVSRVPAVQVGELRRRLFEGRVEEASNGLGPAGKPISTMATR